MDNSILSLDICERILDAFQSYSYAKSTDNRQGGAYATWCHTALVCVAWVSRSRSNLLYDVVLSQRVQSFLLWRTLSRKPELSTLIVRLAMCATATDELFPFEQILLSHRLPKCQSFRLIDVSRTSYSPSRLEKMMSQLSGLALVELELPFIY